MQEPKFTIGQTVYFPSWRQDGRVLRCPDCLGTCKWQVTTPAGETFEMTCGTCCPWLDRSSITEQVFTPIVRKLTIGSVGYEHDGTRETYRYMARETGVGSGSVYDENHLFYDEECARDYAKLLAHNASEEYAARAKRNADEKKRKARRKPCKTCGRTA